MVHITPRSGKEACLCQCNTFAKWSISLKRFKVHGSRFTVDGIRQFYWPSTLNREPFNLEPTLLLHMAKALRVEVSDLLNFHGRLRQKKRQRRPWISSDIAVPRCGERTINFQSLNIFRCWLFTHEWLAQCRVEKAQPLGMALFAGSDIRRRGCLF